MNRNEQEWTKETLITAIAEAKDLLRQASERGLTDIVDRLIERLIDFTAQLLEFGPLDGCFDELRQALTSYLVYEERYEHAATLNPDPTIGNNTENLK